MIAGRPFVIAMPRHRLGRLLAAAVALTCLYAFYVHPIWNDQPSSGEIRATALSELRPRLAVGQPAVSDADRRKSVADVGSKLGRRLRAPANATAAVRRVLVATTWRSGSTFLGELLASW